MYAKNATRGQWKAHGRYVARESASQGRAVEAGFDATERGINIAARLDQWQSAGDERMWKIILSPEFGDKLDLVQTDPRLDAAHDTGSRYQPRMGRCIALQYR
jgi:hypothetical protein